MTKFLKMFTFCVLPAMLPMFLILLLMKILFVAPLWQVISVPLLWLYAIGIVKSGLLGRYIKKLIDKNII